MNIGNGLRIFMIIDFIYPGQGSYSTEDNNKIMAI